MLKLMRKHAKFFYVFFFIIILSFIYWGVGTVNRTGGTMIVAEVGKYKVTAQEYWQNYENVSRFYREIYRDKFNEEMEKNLREQVLDSVITERVLLIAAKDAGIRVSDKELQESIMNDPMFMRDGAFDKQVYLNRLRLNRITPDAYENSKRRELTIMKMRRLIEASVDVPEIDVELQQFSGDEKSMKFMSQALLNEKREKAVKSYVEGLKKKISIKINTEAIS